MGSAEDAIRRRQRADRQRTTADTRHHALQDAKARRDLLEQIHEEIPRAMARLATAGYPGGRIHRHGPFKLKQTVYWVVGAGYWEESHSHGEGDAKEVAVYTDGRLAWTLSRTNIAKTTALSNDELEMLLQNLRELGPSYSPPRRRHR